MGHSSRYEITERTHVVQPFMSWAITMHLPGDVPKVPYLAPYLVSSSFHHTHVELFLVPLLMLGIGTSDFRVFLPRFFLYSSVPGVCE